MRSTTRRLLATLTALPLAAGLVAAADEPDYAAVTETLYISAGCPSDATGTCTSTRWLGTISGDSTSNFTTAITPADEALFRAQGTINWRDYPSQTSAGFRADGYLLDPSRDATLSLSLEGDGVAANVTVHSKIDLRHCATVTDAETGETSLVDCRTKTITAPDQTVLAAAGAVASTRVDFSFDLPDELTGRTATSMTAWVAVHGVNAYWGFIDQQGGSPVTLPHLLELEAPTAG